MDLPVTSTILEDIREEVELEGHEPGTPKFERIYLARRVERCQQMQGVRECRDCRAYLDCSLAKEHMMSVKYGGDIK